MPLPQLRVSKTSHFLTFPESTAAAEEKQVFGCSCSASLWINVPVRVPHPSTSYSSYTSRVIRRRLKADVGNFNLHAPPTAAAPLGAAVFVRLNDSRRCFSHISIIHHVFLPPPIRSNAMNESWAGTVRSVSSRKTTFLKFKPGMRRCQVSERSPAG